MENLFAKVRIPGGECGWDGSKTLVGEGEGGQERLACPLWMELGRCPMYREEFDLTFTQRNFRKYFQGYTLRFCFCLFSLDNFKYFTDYFLLNLSPLFCPVMQLSLSLLKA